MSIKTLWESLGSSPAFRPASISISPDKVDIGHRLNVPFKRNEEYFLVRINEMYLSYKRKWVSTYDPIVYVLSEFSYDAEKFQVPFVVGPSMLKSKIEIPKQGMLYKNTTVAGLHPYKGDSFSLSIVLCRMRQDDYLRKLLTFIESTSATYATTFATAVTSYAKVAHVVLDSIDELLGNSDIDPLIGQRQEYIPSVGDNFVSGFHALVNLDDADVDKNKFYVKNDTLCYGDSLEEAEPYREDDYVLYSIMSTKSRDDYDRFIFNKEFKELQKLVGDIAGQISPEQKELINNKFIMVKNLVRTSPDLIRSQTEELIKDYTLQIQTMINDRGALSGKSFAAKPKQIDGWEQKMDQVVNEKLEF